MRARPKLVEVVPKNYAIDVPVNTSISAEFDIDLDSRYLEDYVYLTDASGEKIKGRVTNRRKKVTFVPLEPLTPGKSYQFFLIGDSDLENNQDEGLRSILGESMAGNIVVSFTTAGAPLILPPALKTPARASVVRQDPVFEWKESEGAEHYEIRVGRSNTMVDLVYPLEDAHKIYENQVELNLEWEEGIYYWSVRAISAEGATSDWSKPSQFHYTRVEEGKISEEDADTIDVAYDQFEDDEIELIEVFPEDELCNTPLNTKSIFFRFIGEVDPSLLDLRALEIVGEHVTGDITEPHHGKLDGKLELIAAPDGTSYLIFSPDPIETDEEEGTVI